MWQALKMLNIIMSENVSDAVVGLIQSFNVLINIANFDTRIIALTVEF